MSYFPPWTGNSSPPNCDDIYENRSKRNQCYFGYSNFGRSVIGNDPDLLDMYLRLSKAMLGNGKRGEEISFAYIAPLMTMFTQRKSTLTDAEEKLIAFAPLPMKSEIATHVAAQRAGSWEGYLPVTGSNMQQVSALFVNNARLGKLITEVKNYHFN